MTCVRFKVTDVQQTCFKLSQKIQVKDVYPPSVERSFEVKMKLCECGTLPAKPLDKQTQSASDLYQLRKTEKQGATWIPMFLHAPRNCRDGLSSVGK